MKLLNFLLLSLFLISGISLYAGDKFGIRAGYQNSGLFVDGSKLTDAKNYNGYYLGVFKENKIIPLLSYGFGLDYMNTGSKVDNDTKRALNYLSIPIYVKAKLGPLYGLAGTGLNIKISEKLFVDGNSTSLSDSQKSKSLDYPVYLGGGFKILIVSIEGRYHWGLSEIINGSKNRYFQIGATISL
jgi:hypothetical protein